MKNRQNTFFFWGRPFSPLYSFLMVAREKLYSLRILSRNNVSTPVISVGNLVLGGTGKTPMVRQIVRFLQKNGFQPAIISRGYRGTAREAINIVSDGQKLLLSADQAGDEPFMLAKTLSKTPVLTGKKRIFPARKAVEMGATCLVLDDGFQHLAVERDINIVLFDSSYHAGNSRVFPGGPLREPVSSLSRADCFVMTGTREENENRAKMFAELLTKRFPEKPVFFAHRSPLSFYDSKGNLCDPRTWGPSFAFCGIAGPDRFSQSLHETAIDIIDFTALPDHAEYSLEQIKSLEEKAKICGAQGMVTTEKDGVKLQDATFSLPLAIARVEMVLPENFWKFLNNRLQKITTNMSLQA